MRYSLIALLLLIFLPASSVLACSGSMANLDVLLANNSTIVRARVVSSDEREENALIQVETYLKGSGEEYLLLFGNSRGTSNGLNSFRYGLGDCAGRYPYMLEGESYYLIIEPYLAGTVHLIGRGFVDANYYFPESDSTTNAYLNDEHVELTETEFLALLSEYSETSTAPIPNERPNPAALRITTESGANYLLPVDGSAPIPLTVETYIMLHNNRLSFYLESEFLDICGENLDCFHFSPSFIDIAVQASENRILLSNSRDIEGQSFLFSSTGDSLAIWNGTNIEVYSIFYYPDVDERLIQLTNEHELLSAEYAAWSPDGRLLAYSDSEGLWLWDVFTENAAPRLLMAAEENVPYAKEFSPLGRYLAVQNGNQASYLDLISGQSLPDGIFSPDERYLVAFNRMETPSPAQFCTLAPFQCRVIREESSYLTELNWQNQNSFQAMWCNVDGVCDIFIESDFVYIVHGWYPQDSENPEYIPARLFAYEAENDLFATVRADYMLNERDLSAYLDSPIASIEWLPSFFYHEN